MKSPQAGAAMRADLDTASNQYLTSTARTAQDTNIKSARDNMHGLTYECISDPNRLTETDRAIARLWNHLSALHWERSVLNGN